MEPDGKVMWTAKEAMTPTTLPKSLLVVGSGAIGIEFASFYRSFGTEVTVVEMQSRIMTKEDLDIAELVRENLEKEGIKILTGHRAVEFKKNELICELSDGSKKEIEFSEAAPGARLRCVKVC